MPFFPGQCVMTSGRQGWCKGGGGDRRFEIDHVLYVYFIATLFYIRNDGARIEIEEKKKEEGRRKTI